MAKNIDEMIKAGLSAQDRQLYDELESDMNLQEMALSAFQGRNRGIKVFAFIMSFVFFLLSLYCVWGFVHTDDVRSAMGWLMGFGFCSLSVAMFKLYFWMEMHKNAVLREVKRVELQLTSLAEHYRSN